MNCRQPLAAALSLLVLMALLVPFAAQSLPQTAAASVSQPSISNPGSNGLLPIHPIAQTIWETSDGPVARLEVARGWLFGPTPLAMTVEPYDQSATGERQLVYFDKGRIDILDPNASVDDYWSAPGGQLVTELLSGAVQLGSDHWVERGPANIPVVGDPDQSRAVTYATLSQHATLPESKTNTAAARSRIGQQITSVLAADGTIDEDGFTGPNVEIARYDDVTRHNIATPFQSWAEGQAYGQLYSLGHPLTEPYWVDAVVGKQSTQVLVQAFERRVLSYTPSNPSGWQTESGNVGQHYRAWRGLDVVPDPAYSPLVASVPFGEELVAAALSAGVDPYLLAAIAEVTAADAGTQLSLEGRHGMLGVRAEVATASDDPAADAQAGARELARLLETSGDERAALTAYHGGSNDPSATFADAVVTTRDALSARQFAPTEGERVTMPIAQLASGPATAFADGYDADWWARNLAWLASWGGALPGATSDPLGYYCVAPGIAAGDRLRLVANSTSIDCTIGGMSGDPSLPDAGDGVVALNRAAFDALGLTGNNDVRVFRLGPAGGTRTGSAVQINSGAAAYYAAGYDVAWWETTMHRYSGWGTAVAGWSVDPNGFYCVHPGYSVGQRLRLVANGVTLDCTVGDTVQQQHLALWQSRWAIEMSWDTFVALGLPGHNAVEVYAVQ